MSVKLSGPMLQPLSGTTKQIVVLLHGYGTDGNDLIGLAPSWRELLPDAMFVAPTAPNPSDINPNGFQWFPLDGDRAVARRAGTADAQPVVLGFLADLWEETGLTAKDTFLVGFSQGAQLVLDVGLRLPEPLMGIVAFSGGLIDPENIEPEIKSKPPICLVHGEVDEVVPVSMTLEGGKALTAAGLEVTGHISAGAGHTIAPDGMEAATVFITKCAGKSVA